MPKEVWEGYLAGRHPSLLGAPGSRSELTKRSPVTWGWTVSQVVPAHSADEDGHVTFLDGSLDKVPAGISPLGFLI